MKPESAHINTDTETGKSELHAEDIESFSDLGLDLPFEFGETIHDAKRGMAHTPIAIGPAENGGFTVYNHTSEVKERGNGDLKIINAGTSGPNSIPMKVLLTILDEDTCKVVASDRVIA